ENGSMGNPWKGFSGPNLGYLNDVYEQYKVNPTSVEEDMKALFDQWGAPPVAAKTHTDQTSPEASMPIGNMEYLEKVVSAEKLAGRIRTYGHLAADLSTLKNDEDDQLLELERYGLTEGDLKGMPARIVWPSAPENIENGLEA